MSVHDTAPEEIMDLTDIVEEGISLDAPADDVPLAKAVDAKSLDDELDSLLDEAGGLDQETPPANDLDFDQLLAETAEAMAPSAKADTLGLSDPGLDDLDEIFNSMAAEQEQQAKTALDDMLDADDARHAATQSKNTGFDLEELLEDEPELTDMKARNTVEPAAAETPAESPAAAEASLMDLTDELLADIPDTVLTPPAGDSQVDNTTIEDQHLLDLADETLQPETSTAQPDPTDIDALIAAAAANDASDTAAQPLQPETQPESPKVSTPEGDIESLIRTETLDTPPAQPLADIPEPELNVSAAGTEIFRAEVDRILERLDHLEGAEPLSPEQLLAMLPDNPADLPATAVLKNDMLTELDTRLSSLGQPEGMAELQQTLTELTGRVQNVEATMQQGPTARQVTDLIPENPDDLPVTTTLKVLLMAELEARLSNLGQPEGVAELQHSLTALSSRIQSVEEDMQQRPTADQITALIPENPDDLPVTTALKAQLTADLEARLNDEAHKSAQDRLQQELDALSGRMQTLEEKPETSLTTDQILSFLPESPDELSVTRQLREELLSDMDARFGRTADADSLNLVRSTLEERIASLGKLPDMAAMRSELLDDMEARVSSLASATALDAVQQTVEALEERMEALPEQVGQQSQEISAEVSELRRLTATQSASIEQLTAALADRDTRLTAVQQDIAALHTELATLRAQNAPDAQDAHRQELRAFISQEIPGAAARILREEIQSLLKDLNG